MKKAVLRSGGVRTRRRVPARTTTPGSTRIFTPHAFATEVEFIDLEPVVLMTREVFSHMWHFVDIADLEVGWLGSVVKTSENAFLIDEVFLPAQEVSSSQTELSEEGQAQLVQELIDSREDGMDVANRLRFWGHSHVRMDTFPSKQDDLQMEYFQGGGCPWFIRGILNKLGRMQFDVYLFEAGIRVTDVPWAIYDEFVDERDREAVEDEFFDMVTEVIYSTPPGPYSGNVLSWGRGWPPAAAVSKGGDPSEDDEGEHCVD